MRNLIVVPLVLFPAIQAFAQNNQQNESDGAGQPAQQQSYWAPDLAIGGLIATDGMFRGLSGTRNRPAAFGCATALSGPFYAGATLMNKDLGPNLNISAESDWTVGVKPTLGPVIFDFNASYDHLMPDDSTDYWEFKAGASTSLPYAVTGTFNYYFSPNYAKASTRENVVELQLNKAINDKWSTSAEIGNVSYGTNPVFKTYAYWDAGVTYNVTPSLSVDLRYYDTNLGSSDCSPSGTCHGRVVLSLAWNTTLKTLLHTPH